MVFPYCANYPGNILLKSIHRKPRNANFHYKAISVVRCVENTSANKNDNVDDRDETAVNEKNVLEK